MELGIYTFADTTRDPGTGRLATAEERLRDLMEEIALADQLGLDVYGVGEHHRPDFSITAPEVVLGALACRTTRIHLGTAVTVLSTDDPVRVFERFSTINALSSGRAEVLTGLDGSESRLAVLEKGDFFGELSLFTHTPRSSAGWIISRTSWLRLA